MSRLLSSRRIVGPLSMIAIAYVLMATGLTWSQSGEAEPATSGAQKPPEPAPPADQQFIGVKQCASCHFDQFMKWKKTKHATSFELLPAEYQADAKCLPCHTTGFGTPSGFKTAAASADLKGTTCESCHGPGSKHAEISKQFANQKLTAEQEKEVRDSIWLVMPSNACIECHKVQGHHESATPPELRKSK